MPYPKCKVYSDGSHYIAIPYIPQKPRYKKRKKMPPPQPEMEVLEVEGPTPFDKFEQMSLFDDGKKEKLSQSIDGIWDKFGPGAIRPAALLKKED